MAHTPRPHRIPGWLKACQRVALILAPPSLRRDHGDEMAEALGHRWAKEVAAGSGAGWRTLVFLARDLVASLPRAWGLAMRAWWGGAVVALRGSDLAAEVRQAARSLGRRPGLTGLVVGTLALGLGANVAIFSVLDRSLRPLTTPGADRLAFITLRHRERGFRRTPDAAEFAPLAGGAGAFDRAEFFQTSRVTWREAGDAPERLPTLELSVGLPDLLEVTPVMGRSFDPADAARGAQPVVMLREAFWRSRFGGDRDVLGSTLTLDETSYVVVGIWPDDVVLNGGGDTPAAVVTVLPLGDELQDGHFTIPVVRLAEGVDPADAAARLGALAEDRTEGGLGDWRLEVTGLTTFFGNDLARGVWLTYLGVGLLLLVAVANVANLLIGRAVGRARELGVRLALGASGAHVVRVFLAESLVLVGAGTALAIPIGRWILDGVEAVRPRGLAILRPAVLDAHLTAYAVGLSIAAALLISVPPIVGLRTRDVRRLVGGAGVVGGGHLHQALVGAQVALTTVLVIGAGLTLRSLHRLAAVDPGFDLDHVLVVAVSLPASRYASPEEREAFNREMLTSLEALPGVEGITSASGPPLSYSIRFSEPYLEDEEAPPQSGEFTSTQGVLPGYFGVLGIPLLEGRDFTLDEALTYEPGTTPVIVNEAFARMHGGSVVGRRVRFPGDTIGSPIVGVVGNMRSAGLADLYQDRVQFYYPRSDPTDGFTRYLLRASGDPAALSTAVRRRVAELDPTLPLLENETGDGFVEASTARQRFLTRLLGALGALATVLAFTGVYGVVSLAVSQRVREIGLRIALGAGRVPVVQEVVSRGIRPVALGVGAGLAGAVAAARLLREVLFEVRPADPATLALAATLLLGAGVVACLVPARRATRVDPMVALRED